MRLPGRLHVVWQDDRTLTIETDAGTQVRTLRFSPATTGASDWQGNSQASWDRMEGAMGAGLPFGGGGFGVGNTGGGALKVVTKGMKPGYLRKNGVPYSADAVIVRDRVRALVRSGATLEQVKAARPTADYDTRYGATTGPWTTDMFVEAVYRTVRR